jgi:hypothetical protein
MSLCFKLQLVVMADDDEVCVDDVVVLDKQHERLEHVGLSLGEAKALLLELQRQVVIRQLAPRLAPASAAPPESSRTRLVSRIGTATPMSSAAIPARSRASIACAAVARSRNTAGTSAASDSLINVCMNQV